MLSLLAPWKPLVLSGNYKVAIAFLVCVTCGLIVYGWRIGTLLRKSRERGDSRPRYLVSLHLSMWMSAAGVLLVAVVLIETRVRMSPNPYWNLPLLMFHLGIVLAAFLIALLTFFRFTGLSDRTMHRRLVYKFLLPLFALMLGSGAMLWYQF